MDNFTPYQPQQIPPPLPSMVPMPPMRNEDFGMPRRRGGGGGGGSPWMMIGITAAVLFVGVLLIVFKARSVASAGFNGPGIDSSENRQLAATQVGTLRSQIALFRLQHDDRLPDFVRYPDWEQLTQMTDRMGKASGGTRKTGYFVYGPYVQRKPVNPLNGHSKVFVAAGGRTPPSRLPGGQTAGFVMHTPSGRLFLTDVTGTKVLTSDPR